MDRRIDRHQRGGPAGLQRCWLCEPEDSSHIRKNEACYTEIAKARRPLRRSDDAIDLHGTRRVQMPHCGRCSGDFVRAEPCWEMRGADGRLAEDLKTQEFPQRTAAFAIGEKTSQASRGCRQPAPARAFAGLIGPITGGINAFFRLQKKDGKLNVLNRVVREHDPLQQPSGDVSSFRSGCMGGGASPLRVRNGRGNTKLNCVGVVFNAARSRMAFRFTSAEPIAEFCRRALAATHPADKTRSFRSQTE